MVVYGLENGLLFPEVWANKCFLVLVNFIFFYLCHFRFCLFVFDCTSEKRLLMIRYGVIPCPWKLRFPDNECFVNVKNEWNGQSWSEGWIETEIKDRFGLAFIHDVLSGLKVVNFLVNWLVPFRYVLPSIFMSQKDKLFSSFCSITKKVCWWMW